MYNACCALHSFISSCCCLNISSLHFCLIRNSVLVSYILVADYERIKYSEDIYWIYLLANSTSSIEFIRLLYYDCSFRPQHSWEVYLSFIIEDIFQLVAEFWNAKAFDMKEDNGFDLIAWGIICIKHSSCAHSPQNILWMIWLEYIYVL